MSMVNRIVRPSVDDPFMPLEFREKIGIGCNIMLQQVYASGKKAGKAKERIFVANKVLDDGLGIIAQALAGGSASAPVSGHPDGANVQGDYCPFYMAFGSDTTHTTPTSTERQLYNEWNYSTITGVSTTRPIYTVLAATTVAPITFTYVYNLPSTAGNSLVMGEVGLVNVANATGAIATVAVPAQSSTGTYAVNDVLTITSGQGGNNVTATPATCTVASVSAGKVATVTITNAGTRYSKFLNCTTTSNNAGGGNGVGATLSITSVGATFFNRGSLGSSFFTKLTNIVINAVCVLTFSSPS